MVSLLIGVLGSMIAWAVCSEIDGWGQSLAHRLLAWAVRKLPADRRERYLEEWSAHLDTLPTSLSKLLVGFHFGFAAVQMRIEVDGITKISAAGQNVTMRIVDVAVSLTLLVAVGPMMAAFAVLIYANDPGPILVAQRRVGKGGRVFYRYKFRTMRVDAQARLLDLLANDPPAREAWERDHCLLRDPRLTSIGALLEKSSLDELPQLFNVLLGTMSLVGPRPIIEAEIKRYGKYFRDYAAVRPGITGLRQIFGRGKDTYRRRVAMDTALSRNRSLRFYLKLLLLTMQSCLRSRRNDR